MCSFSLRHILDKPNLLNTACLRLVIIQDKRNNLTSWCLIWNNDLDFVGTRCKTLTAKTFNSFDLKTYRLDLSLQLALGKFKDIKKIVIISK